jgi:hypothetical protein
VNTLLLIVAFLAFAQTVISDRNGARKTALIAVTVGFVALLVDSVFFDRRLSALGYIGFGVLYVLALWKFGALKRTSQPPLPPD